jgi:hypothetical protein
MAQQNHHNNAQAFVQLRFLCKYCDCYGIILSACANLTYLILEGFCPSCRKGASRTYDLLKLDASLAELRPDPDMTSVLVASVPTQVQPVVPVRGEIK